MMIIMIITSKLNIEKEKNLRSQLRKASQIPMASNGVSIERGLKRKKKRNLLLFISVLLAPFCNCHSKHYLNAEFNLSNFFYRWSWSWTTWLYNEIVNLSLNLCT